ncbi:MAG: hypothetical protein AB1847_20175 [bacterium]
MRSTSSPELAVVTEEIIPLPEAVQNMIDLLATDQQTAEKVKDSIAVWATKQRDRLMRWRVHTMTEN